MAALLAEVALAFTSLAAVAGRKALEACWETTTLVTRLMPWRLTWTMGCWEATAPLLIRSGWAADRPGVGSESMRLVRIWGATEVRRWALVAGAPE